MKKSKLFSVLMSSFILLSSVPFGISSVTVSADDSAIEEVQFSDSTEIIETKSNDLYKAFLKKINSAEFKNEFNSLSDSEKEKKITDLFIEFEGAEVSLAVVDNDSFSTARASNPNYSQTGWTEKFVNGGLNDYATTKAGLKNLKGYYNYCKGVALGSTTSFGAAIGGGMGALAGLLTGSVLYARLNTGESLCSSYINAGKTKGGVRMTVTDCFKINSINSIKRA
ncbi:hypothetical protein HED39_17225 [Enterococcus casseliflavus]|uniref:hypothetical protein n=1 Tax=Enterococcus casseliflavus TaxID=37734 RepID=UPI0014332C5A|nr:hypothetical protein [Enterococcus casseliflavus]NKD31017.1 hypothetical protein [Enterococcus casseliflavus]